jgi:hypothetical protein
MTGLGRTGGVNGLGRSGRGSSGSRSRGRLRPLREHPHDDGITPRRDLVGPGGVERDDHSPNAASLVLVLRRGDLGDAALLHGDRRGELRDVGAGQVHDEARRILELENRVRRRPGPLDHDLDRAVALRDVERADRVRLGGAHRNHEGAREEDCEAQEVDFHGRYSSRFIAASRGRRMTV